MKEQQGRGKVRHMDEGMPAPTAARSRIRPVGLIDLAPELRGLAAGLAGLLAWECVARVVAPIVIGGPLDPDPLIAAALGVDNQVLIELLHVSYAMAVMPVSYLLLVQPVARLILRRPPWPLTGVLLGLAAWLVAMTVIASYLAGFPPFLDWSAVAWMSLSGHLAMGLAIAGCLHRLNRSSMTG